MDHSPTPKWTAYVLDRGPRMCRRRLALEHEGHPGTKDVFTRWRVREQLVGTLIDAHSTLGHPPATALTTRIDFSGLTEEEFDLCHRAADGYSNAFAGEPVRTRVDHGADSPTLVAELGVRLGGGIDLVAENPTGQLEVRQLELWNKPVEADPHASWAMLVVALRLSDWAGERELRLRVLDPYAGNHDEYRYLASRDRDTLVARLTARHEELLERIKTRPARIGWSCNGCGWVADCSAMREVA